ncbi:N-acetylmuramic acid 6-phosphate etherase [Pedobacter alpinus]|uniref:N-acetylmuramic acid 6-phosphate etherase n=1 Tax=Pedobacter alpinus TaxID=1590643 RepID=A0ABW5TMA6_9SPHI
MTIEITEQDSTYTDLEKKSTKEILKNINQEDKTVPLAVEKVISKIEAFVDAAAIKMQKGGRIFYIGAGTSGRLGILDASECPPTFGVPASMVVGIIAGGDTAIRKAVENAEDDKEQAWKDLLLCNITANDVLLGIAASGKTPYVIGGLNKANEKGILTGCIVCNENSPIAKAAQYPIEVIVGPEYLTGSTRMKAGTAQKLVLNMISTTLMIKLGRVKGNKMVDMQLTNTKLVNRGTKMIMAEIDVDEKTASKLLDQFGSVRKAVEAYLASLQ